jgi:hypothetical protein
MEFMLVHRTVRYRIVLRDVIRDLRLQYMYTLYESYSFFVITK